MHLLTEVEGVVRKLGLLLLSVADRIRSVEVQPAAIVERAAGDVTLLDLKGEMTIGGLPRGSSSIWRTCVSSTLLVWERLSDHARPPAARVAASS